MSLANYLGEKTAVIYKTLRTHRKRGLTWTEAVRETAKSPRREKDGEHLGYPIPTIWRLLR